MEKKKSSQQKLQGLLKKKRVWALLLIAVAVGFFFLRPTNNAKNTVTDTVKYVDLKQTVLATGQVTSQTDLSLSFSTSGIVRSLRVKVGDKVSSGQTLATLDQGSTLGALTQARGALAGAQARLKHTLEGSSDEEIKLAQIALTNAKLDYDNTKTTQATFVNNAYINLLNSTPEAVPEKTTTDYSVPTITGNYNLKKEGTIKITSYAGTSSFAATGLVNASGIVSTTAPQSIGNSGLSIQFATTTSNVSSWLINIPNKNAANYPTNFSAYQSALDSQATALSSAQSLIDERVAELALKQVAARSSDIDLARADIVTAEGQVQAAQSKYDDAVIHAPASGTITKVDIKLGELAQALKEAFILQDVSNVYLETNVNEANIAHVTLGLPVDITFDAFGPSRILKGSITKVDPSSTLISGVVNYKVTANVEKAPDLRPGMTANLTIKVKEKDHVLAIPSRAIITDKKGAMTVRVVTDPKTKAYKDVAITTGLEGDGGLIEVVSGLSLGQEFVVLIKS